MKKRRIIAIHLLNDLSGSPLVFRQALEALVAEGYSVHLFTATPSGEGFLNGIGGVVRHRIAYRWSPNRWLTLLFFLCNQAVLFFRVLVLAHRRDIVYVNTMLPFGAALAGKLKGCRIVFHIHETSIKPAALKRWLLFVAGTTAHKLLFVSDYLRENTPITNPYIVIPNVLPFTFTREIPPAKPNYAGKFNVLMLCSLKGYKGIGEFVACARLLPSMEFDLVVNSTQSAIDLFFRAEQLPANLRIHPAQTNVHPFYVRASVVVNFSRIDQWVETFGMTVLEAMYYGKPVIVPTVGGVTELVDEEITGYLRDSRDTQAVVKCLHYLSVHPNTYDRMCNAAKTKARNYSPKVFQTSIISAINSL